MLYVAIVKIIYSVVLYRGLELLYDRKFYFFREKIFILCVLIFGEEEERDFEVD